MNTNPPLNTGKRVASQVVDVLAKLILVVSVIAIWASFLTFVEAADPNIQINNSLIWVLPGLLAMAFFRTVPGTIARRIAAAILSICTVSAIALHFYWVEVALWAASVWTQQELPVAIDDGVAWTGFETQGRQVTNIYEIHGVAPYTLSPEEADQFNAELCMEKLTALMSSEGVTYHYVYMNNEGNQLIRHTLNPGDCR